MIKINYFDCIYRFKPEAGYGCNCSKNKSGKCTPDNKIPGQLDECEYICDFTSEKFNEEDYQFLEDYLTGIDNMFVFNTYPYFRVIGVEKVTTKERYDEIFNEYQVEFTFSDYDMEKKV